MKDELEELEAWRRSWSLEDELEELEAWRRSWSLEDELEELGAWRRAAKVWSLEPERDPRRT